MFDQWFETCKTGTVEDVQNLIKQQREQRRMSLICQRDQRNNCVDAE